MGQNQLRLNFLRHEGQHDKTLPDLQERNSGLRIKSYQITQINQIRSDLQERKICLKIKLYQITRGFLRHKGQFDKALPQLNNSATKGSKTLGKGQ